MSLHRIQSFVMALACLTLAGEALAQNTPAPNTPAPSAPLQATTAPNVPTPPDADETFLTGLRRVGVMAGQVVECSADAEKQAKIGQAMELAPAAFAKRKAIERPDPFGSGDCVVDGRGVQTTQELH